MAKVKFKPTKAQQSLVADSGAKGDSFELLAKFKQEGEDWCLTHVENEPMPGYEEGDQKPASDMKGGKVGSAYMEAMKGGAGSPGNNYGQ